LGFYSQEQSLSFMVLPEGTSKFQH